ncbi:hypothetical protein P4112_13800 [Pseudomonas aeruginosa]|nr:hypothetical protein [Pseudomonas aeruginosa]
MLDHDLTVALLCRLNQNQSALGMALEELAIWAKRHEGGETYDVVMNHLQTLERNADFVAEAIVVLMRGSLKRAGPVRADEPARCAGQGTQ